MRCAADKRPTGWCLVGVWSAAVGVWSAAVGGSWRLVGGSRRLVGSSRRLVGGSRIWSAAVGFWSVTVGAWSAFVGGRPHTTPLLSRPSKHVRAKAKFMTTLAIYLGGATLLNLLLPSISNKFFNYIFYVYFASAPQMLVVMAGRTQLRLS